MHDFTDAEQAVIDQQGWNQDSLVTLLAAYDPAEHGTRLAYFRAVADTENGVTAINPDATVLIVGNPVDGLRLIGPFDNGDDAISYAEDDPDIRDDNWWAAPIVNVQVDAEGKWIH